jgi:hypothetical protein
MKRKGLALLIGLVVLSFALVGCAGKTDGNAAASPSAPAATDTGAAASASPSASPSAAASADATVNGFVMGKVTAISGSQITLDVVNPAGSKTITVDSTLTQYAIAGSTKTAALSDIAIGDVITATLAGDTALKIINDGPNVNPDPSAYASPSPSDTAAASPSAS